MPTSRTLITNQHNSNSRKLFTQHTKKSYKGNHQGWLILAIHVYLLLILRMAKHYYVPLHGLEKNLILYTFTLLIYFKLFIFTFTLTNLFKSIYLPYTSFSFLATLVQYWALNIPVNPNMGGLFFHTKLVLLLCT